MTSKENGHSRTKGIAGNDFKRKVGIAEKSIAGNQLQKKRGRSRKIAKKSGHSRNNWNERWALPKNE